MAPIPNPRHRLPPLHPANRHSKGVTGHTPSGVAGVSPAVAQAVRGWGVMGRSPSGVAGVSPVLPPTKKSPLSLAGKGVGG